jgi:hypothetical protein
VDTETYSGLLIERHSVIELLDAADDRAALDLLVKGFQISRMLRLVAELGVADRIATDGKVAVETLAVACGARPQPLMRVLRALAAFGVFAVDTDGQIAHTPRSRLMRTDIPNSMHHFAHSWAATGVWSAWGMLDVAMTGGVPHQAAWNAGRFDYLRTHPDEARAFDAMMANAPDNRHGALAAAYDFSGAALIADIGGGNGATLRHILGLFPSPRGLLFDSVDVVRAVPAEDLVGGRIAVVAGDMFDVIPGDADVYLLVRVLHDWPDDDCIRILRNCRTAMRPDAVLLIGEQILEPDPARAQPTGYLIDTMMMAMFGSARERTEGEFASLLAESGFALRRVVQTESFVSIVESAPL